MKRIFLALCLAVWGCDTGWWDVTSPTMGFQVSMPGHPVRTVYDSTPSKWKGERFHLDPGGGFQMMAAPERAFTYSAGGEIIPAGWTRERVVDKYLEDRLAPTSQQRAVERKEIISGELDGVEFRIVDHGVLLQSRIFIKNDRVFALDVLSGEKAADPKTIDRFFNFISAS